jgi:hypothetical protein
MLAELILHRTLIIDCLPLLAMRASVLNSHERSKIWI